MSINQAINVNAFYFQNGRGLRSFPREVEFNNTRLQFSDGLQYVVGKGSGAIKLFDMTDGHATYRLRLQDNTWTLVSSR